MAKCVLQLILQVLFLVASSVLPGRAAAHRAGAKAPPKQHFLAGCLYLVLLDCWELGATSKSAGENAQGDGWIKHDVLQTCWGGNGDETPSFPGTENFWAAGSDTGLKVGPHWLLIGQIDDSERREMEAKQGGFCACTAFPSVSVVHCWRSIKILHRMKYAVFLHYIENCCYVRVTYFSGSALSVPQILREAMLVKNTLKLSGEFGAVFECQKCVCASSPSTVCRRFTVRVTKLTVCNTVASFSILQFVVCPCVSVISISGVVSREEKPN